MAQLFVAVVFTFKQSQLLRYFFIDELLVFDFVFEGLVLVEELFVVFGPPTIVIEVFVESEHLLLHGIQFGGRLEGLRRFQDGFGIFEFDRALLFERDFS